VALEDDAVEALEHGDDQAGKPGDEARQRLHGVLLQAESSELCQETPNREVSMATSFLYLAGRMRLRRESCDDAVPQRSREPQIREPMLRVGANSKPAFRR
jgi:hypothetical protein